MINAGKPYRRKSDNLWVVPIYMPTKGDGKRNRKTVANKNKRNAILAAQLRVTELRNAAVNVDHTMTVAQWVNYWIEEVAPARTLRPKTIAVYKDMIKNQIIPTVGSYKIAQLTPAHIREMHAGISARGLSTSTTQLAHTVLQVSLDDALKDEMINRNVAKIAGKPKGDTESRGALTVEQAHHFITTAVNAGDPMATRWALALITGARQGECIGLEWNRVNFDTNEIDLTWALNSIGEVHGCLTTPAGLPSCGAPLNYPSRCPQRRPNISPGYKCRHLRGPLVLAAPKTESSRRIITMIGPIRDALLHQREHAIPNDYGLVWVTPKTHTPINPVGDRRRWKEALKRAGLPDMVLHSARHTAATLMQEMDVPKATRMEIMGHNSEAMARKYAHGRDIQGTGAAIANLGDAIMGGAFGTQNDDEDEPGPLALPA